MCVYVCVYVCVRVYVCVYVCICVYMYVCICIMYACIYVYMHSCIFVSSSSPTAMGSAPVGVRCQFHQLPPTFSLRSHLCIFVYVCIIIICLGGNVRWENVLLKTGGGIVRGRIVRRGIVRGDYCPIVDCQTSDLCELQQNPHAYMDDRSSLDLEAEHGVTMDDMLASPWLTGIVEVRFQNTCRCDKRGEKNTRGLQLRLTAATKGANIS